MHEQKIIRCKNCGGSVTPMAGFVRYFRCEYCNNVQTQMSDRESIILETAFDKLRQAEFDDAEEQFNQILHRAHESYEAYWGRALARFGITFVDDYRENKRVPTVHKIAPSSFTRDSDYTRAIAYAPKEIAAGYRDSAERIERIRAGQMSAAEKEKPYDIFICYKESDESARLERTRDSYDASDLYVHLTSLGYRVFFSRESLRGFISEEYEPYIYNALATAKVMIVYGTKPEYMKSTWVKNEWSRFQKLIDLGVKQPNSLVVAASQMPVSMVPDALKSRQVMDADFRTFYTDLDRHIAKIIGGAKAAAADKASAHSGARFCSGCGASVPGIARFCQKCGKECKPIDPFDHAPIRRTQAIDPFAHSPAAHMPTKPANKGKNKKLHKFGSIVFAISLIFFVVSMAFFEDVMVTMRFTLSLFLLGLSIAAVIVSKKSHCNIGMPVAAIVFNVINFVSAAVLIA